MDLDSIENWFKKSMDVEVAEKAIKNSHKKVLSVKVDSAKKALSIAFEWDRRKEKFQYWFVIYNSL